MPFHHRLGALLVFQRGQAGICMAIKNENRPEMAFLIKNFEEKNMDKRIVIICMTGHRSPIVAHRLKKRGYQNVYNLVWGMWAWKLFGGKTE
jgi:rhodanese-related sulfurtransferase